MRTHDPFSIFFFSFTIILVLFTIALSCYSILSVSWGTVNNKQKDNEEERLYISEEWCAEPYYLDQWADNFKSKRIAECLNVPSNKRQHCIKACTRDPDTYRWMLPAGTSKIICDNSPVYDTFEAKLNCYELLTKDCINGCFELPKR